MTFSSSQNKICIIPRVSPYGGPGSFSTGLTSGFDRQGIQTCYDLADPTATAVLVIGGTRHLGGLLRARRQGKRIVQRLNGMNWMHRAAVSSAGLARIDLRYFIRAEINNILLASIRKWLATSIVYQSQFSMDWWNRVYGEVNTKSSVIYNAVDLEQFKPDGPSDLPQDRFRILLVEGNIFGGYQMGLKNAIDLAEQLQALHHLPIELKIVGNVPETIQTQWKNRSIAISWDGMLSRDQIPFSDRSAHLLFSADLNAACPNSVIEALACGLPVLSFDTGGLKELVRDQAGMVVPYGSNHWKLASPVMAPLVEAAHHIINNQAAFRQFARTRAVSTFGLDAMVSAYYKSLCG